jgi:phage shock protein B
MSATAADAARAISDGLLIIPILIFSIPLAAIIGATLVALVKAIRGTPRGEARKAAAEETMLIQDIHEGLARMEQRVEALETLLLDRERDKRKGRGQ